MTVKWRPKVAKASPEDLLKPSKWRLQHDGFPEPNREADPDTGSLVQHRRTVDTLRQMPAKGSIAPQMHEAGCIFRTLSRSAAIDRMATSQLIRVDGSNADSLSTRQLDARRRMLRTFDALGGHVGPARSCVWFVVGLEMSVPEWATRQGWCGRPVPQPIASGMLVVAPGILILHFGLIPRQRKRSPRILPTGHACDSKHTDCTSRFSGTHSSFHLPIAVPEAVQASWSESVMRRPSWGRGQIVLRRA